jgi:hypothetical protein
MKDDSQKPVFIFDDGWFELPWRDNLNDKRYGYRIWDVQFRWNAIPAALQPYAWLVLYVPWENITSRRNSGDVYTLIDPEPDPLYDKKLAAFLEGMDYAEKNNIPVLLMVRRSAKGLLSAPNYELVARLLKDFSCVKGVYYNELAGSGLKDADEEHLTTFTAMAKENGKKAIWSMYFDKNFPAWNFFMADPKWQDFFHRNKDTLVPLWKNVEPFNNMLLWSDCVGMWLSGLVDNWGMEFDDWYWINYFCHSRGMHRSNLGPDYHGEDTFEMSEMSCPPYLLKDTMILAALTGAKYFKTEADPSFVPYDSPYGSFGGSLRSTRLKLAELIASGDVRRSLPEVAENVRVAVETPTQCSDIAKLGYQYTYPSEGPNILFKEALGIPDGSFCTLPKKAPFSFIPVFPHQEGNKSEIEVVQNPEMLATALAAKTPCPISSDDPDVLIFDAGEMIYVTDNREEDRSNRIITLKDTSCGKYEFIWLAEDSTPLKVKAPSVSKSASGNEMRIPLFAGTSYLIRKIPEKS